MTLRLVLVVPRYGEGFSGGVEAQARQLAADARAAGWHVTVLTTTLARMTAPWQDAYPAGPTTLDDTPVERFPVDPANAATLAHIHHRIDADLRAVSPEDRATWARIGIVDATFYARLAEHARAADFVLFLPYHPYLFNTTALDDPDVASRAVAIPCLHDEPHARTPEVRALLQRCRGILFNCEAERRFADQSLDITHPTSVALGERIHPAPPGNPSDFPRPRPYLLYVGRLEHGKNVPWLLRAFAHTRTRHPDLDLDLVCLGGGTLPDGPRDGVITPGFVDEPTKRAALAGALALVNPSRRESFSLVIMESWLQRRPVIVHRRCPPTHDHVRRSGGGLAVGSPTELAAAIRALHRDPVWADHLGTLGEAYVRRRYTSEAVPRRLARTLTAWRAICRV